MSRDITLLHPKLQRILKEMKTVCDDHGLSFIVTDGFRTQEEQEKLYAQGRTASGSIVTNARYPNSTHCWGIAFDFCRSIKGLEYENSDHFFEQVAQIGKSFGLAWGGDWSSFVDKPHLYLKEFSPDGTASKLIAEYGNPMSFVETWSNNVAGFTDVTNADWYADDIKWAKEQGLIKGYDDGTFRPDRKVTRAEMISILHRWAVINYERYVESD